MSEVEIESTEEWKPVVGYEGVYSVSSLGRVRRDAPGHGTYKGRILNNTISIHGYQIVGLSRDNKRKPKQTHRLVAEAFLGPRPEGMFIAHNNGIKTDNRIVNLRYTSQSENLLDGHRYGGKLANQKLSLQDVSDIRYLLNAGYKAKDLAFAFRCTVNNIYAIKNGWSWAHRLDQTLLVPTAD